MDAEQGADPRQFSPRSPLVTAAIQADETDGLFADWLLAKDNIELENCLCRVSGIVSTFRPIGG